MRFFSTDSGFSCRHTRYTSIDVVFTFVNSIFRSSFWTKIFNYTGFDFDTVMYFRIFSLNPFISPSIYLLVIAKELISLKFQKLIKISVLILLGSFLFHLVYPSQIAWQLMTFLVLIYTLIFLSILIGSWKSNPEYRFITVVML